MMMSDSAESAPTDPEREYTVTVPEAQIRCASAGCTDPSAARASMLSHEVEYGSVAHLEVGLCQDCYSAWNDRHGDEIDKRAVTWLTIYRNGRWWTEADWQQAWDAARSGPIE